MTKDGNTNVGSASQIERLVSRDELIAGYKEDGRTVYRQAGKAKLVTAARQSGASVARLAREHDLNANQLHAWIRQSLRRGTPAGKAANVAAGMEKAAQTRAKTANGVAAASTAAPTLTPARLLPVMLTPAPVPVPAAAPAHSVLIIEIGGARIHIEGDIDQAALATVVNCLQGIQGVTR
jgi:transposase-like protein